MSEIDCIFCKIANKEIDTNFITEADDYVSFKDINQQAPVHALVIPKKHFSSINEIDEVKLLGTLMDGSRKTAEKLGIQDNYRLVVNTGELAGQSVFHLHVHVLGGRPMLWPPG